MSLPMFKGMKLKILKNYRFRLAKSRVRSTLKVNKMRLKHSEGMDKVYVSV